MRQPNWDKFETALLIEAYWEIKADHSKRRFIVRELSSFLRKRASFEIDATFRNENGINMRLGELDYLFSLGNAGLKNTSELFREMVNIYLNNKPEYEKILSGAKEMNVITPNTRTQFCEWLHKKAPKLMTDTICQWLNVGEDFCLRIKVLTNPLFETIDVDTIKKFVRTVTNNKFFLIRNKKHHLEIVNAANWYLAFVREMPNLIISAQEETISTQNENNDDERGSNPITGSSFEAEFYSWLRNVENMAIPTCRSYVSALHSAESFAAEHNITTHVLCTVESDMALATASALMQDEEFRKFNQQQHNRFSAAFQKLNKYFSYLYPEKFGMLQTPAKAIDSAKEKQSIDVVSPTLVDSLDAMLHSSVDGIAKNEICERFSNYSTHQINLALETCHAVLVMKKYYHRDNISDYREMSDILYEVISKQFSQNGNYTSAQQLYNEVRPRLDDFFFYNNAFDSRQEVYDLAVHLFEQEKYKGSSFIFTNNMHIWKEEPDYPKDYHGLMIKYAREHGNTFSREDAISYFEQIGSTTPAATFSNVIFNTGSKSFLQYAENQFVLTEAIQINGFFLASVATQIEKLLDGEDYIATGEIDDYFYTTLPALPSGIFWSALLLEDVLRIFEIGFTTIEAGKDNDKKTIPAAIVRKKSHYQNFGDVVWNEVSKAFPLPKEFTASEFREFLLNKGFIRGSEKMWSVHKTVAGDIRFYWTDNNGKVTIN